VAWPERHVSILSFVTALCLALSFGHAAARTILVGPHRELKLPSEAAKVAADGDTVVIDPKKGGYDDCAIWTQSGLTIEGRSGGVALVHAICDGKAIFVIDGRDTTIRNLTFARARTRSGNGAGIRQEGANLRVEDSRFIDDEDGILAASDPTSAITIANSTFIGDGACVQDEGCGHGIYVNVVGLLHVEHSVFRDTRHGHHIKSRALRTEILDNVISDGPAGNSSYLIDIPNGGAVTISGNRLEKGPRSENHTCAIAIGFEGERNPTPAIVVSGNSFTNDMTTRTIFLKNETTTPARLIRNVMKGDVDLFYGAGSAS